MTWLGVSLSNDAFGQELLSSGIDAGLISSVCDNAIITLPDGTTGPAFDLLEDKDSSEAVGLFKLLLSKKD